MIKNKFLEMLWYKKAVSILVLLQKLTRFNKKKINCSVIAKESDYTYSHAIKILNKIEKVNLIEFERNGRDKNIILTENGSNVANYFKTIIKILE